MMFRLIVRRLAGLITAALGLFLLFVALWLITEEIWPQAQASGWSLSGSSMILNRTWEGNELYILVLLYLAFGLAAVAGGVLLWRRPRTHAPDQLPPVDESIRN